MELKEKFDCVSEGDSFEIKEVSVEKGNIMPDSIIGTHNVWKKKKNSKKKYNYTENESILENSELWIKTECMGEVFFIYPMESKVLITKNHMDFACIETVNFSI